MKKVTRMWVILWIKDVAWSPEEPQSLDVDTIDTIDFTALTHLAARQSSQQAEKKPTQPGVNQPFTRP